VQLEECVKRLGTGRVFGHEDLWEIAHLPALPSESARLALRELHAAVSRVGPVSPSVALPLRRHAHDVHVADKDSDRYPAGGFDAISTRGTFENLVRSEVAYVGEGRDGSSTIDMFDVRFVETELLFYTRDESPLLDARRDATVAIDRPAEQRYKTAALPAQTLVMVQGLVMALQADLLRVFGPSGSRLRIVWRCESRDDVEAADQERALLAFTLGAEIAHQRVELVRARTWDELSEPARVVFSPCAADATVGDAAWVRVGGESWRLGETTYELASEPTAMRALADRLLEVVASRRSRCAAVGVLCEHATGA
jgi:hypothetical protein